MATSTMDQVHPQTPVSIIDTRIEQALRALGEQGDISPFGLSFVRDKHAGVLSGGIRWQVKRAESGFIDRIEVTAQECTIAGWALNARRDAPADAVIAMQNGVLIPGQRVLFVERADVNAAFHVAPEVKSGFYIVLSAPVDVAALTVLAVDRASVVELSKTGAVVSAPESDSPLPEAATPEYWRSKVKQPLFAFQADSPFAGILALRPDFDPRQTVGVTRQFIEDAATYHRKYSAHERWRSILERGVSAARMNPVHVRSILDVGSGSGNSVLPALDLFPNATILATDISPQLLAILREQIPERNRHRCLCIAMDASEPIFCPEQFDIAIGAAILHHIPDPARTIESAVTAVRRDGKVFFFEPFQGGNAVLALIYDELLERRTELEMPDLVSTVFKNIRRDLDVRLGVQVADASLYHLDDKWLFTRAYFETHQWRLGCSRLDIDTIDDPQSPFESQIRTHLKLCLDSGPEVLNERCWAVVRRYDRRFLAGLRSELLMEGMVTLTR